MTISSHFIQNVIIKMFKKTSAPVRNLNLRVISHKATILNTGYPAKKMSKFYTDCDRNNIPFSFRSLLTLSFFNTVHIRISDWQ